MAYERYDDQREDDLMQLELQQQLGGAEPKMPGLVEMPTAPMPKPQKGGVTGGADMGGPAAMPDTSRADAARKAKESGYTDIEGAGGLKTGGYMGALEGFNTGGWGSGERGSNTHKNTFGKIASRYDPKSKGSVRALMNDPDFQAYFPDAKLVQHQNEDLIDFGDGNPVDVLRGATAGGAGEAWQWGVDATQGGAGGEAVAGMGGGGTGDIMAQLEGILGGGAGDTNQLQQILQELMQQGGGAPVQV